MEISAKQKKNQNQSSMQRRCVCRGGGVQSLNKIERFGNSLHIGVLLQLKKNSLIYKRAL